MPMPRKVRPACRLEGCNNPTTRPGRPYCSRNCASAAWAKQVSLTCSYCGRAFSRPPSQVSPGDHQFCEPSHYHEWKRKQSEQVARRCGREGCENQIPNSSWAKEARFCSNRCSGLAKRTRVTRSCPVCSNRFEAEPREVESGRGKYCSANCRVKSTRRRVTITCSRPTCDNSYEVQPYRVQRERFCRSCRRGRGAGPPQTIVCACGCGQAKLVPQYLIQKGFGLFFSMACYQEFRRASRPLVDCERRGCLKRSFPVSPSQRRRRFCSGRCYNLARRPGTFRCRACREFTTRKPGRRPTYCSRRCSNRGRRRHRPLLLAHRNWRILEMASNGLQAPEIRDQLRDDLRERMSIWAIYKVIAREGRTRRNGTDTVADRLQMRSCPASL
jgi:hypothetical protein